MSDGMSELDMGSGMSEVEAKAKTKSKEITMGKGMSEVETNDIIGELETIEAEIRELEEDFGEFDLGLEDDDDTEQESSNELDKLNSAIEGTVFEVSLAESSGDLTILQIADGIFPDQDMPEGWTDWVKKKAKKYNPGKLIRNVVKSRAANIIKSIVRLVKKYKKLSVCVPTVTIAVASFKTGKYGSALKSGYSAYKCIRARL